MKETISAIVPAYNERKTIRRVTTDLSKIDFLTEIIIIDDGSDDGTGNLIETRPPKIKHLRNEKNKGKGFSVARGLEISNGEIVLILDADIINYTEKDLMLLVEPLISGVCDYTMKMTDAPSTKFTSGVRAYWKKDLVALIKEMKETTRYGLEVLLNERLSGLDGKFATLNDYKHFQKFDKYPLPQALWEYLKEGLSILVQELKQN